MGPALVIDPDKAARVGVDAGRGEPQIVRVGAAADGQQHMAAEDDYQVLRQEIQVHHAGVGEVRYVLQGGPVGRSTRSGRAITHCPQLRTHSRFFLAA
jgi:hypothetical protein